MSRTSLRFVAVLIALSALTDFRAWTEAAPHVGYSHCPRDRIPKPIRETGSPREPTDASPIRPDIGRAPPRATSNATDSRRGLPARAIWPAGRWRIAEIPSPAQHRQPFQAA